MPNCKNCELYSIKYDELRQRFNDTNDDEQETHFCKMYDECVNPDVWIGKTKCEFYNEKWTVNNG